MTDFEFDLEKDLKDHKKFKQMKDETHQKMADIKKLLRTGASDEDFEELGILLQAYGALDVVLGRNGKTK